ncbi:MAG: type II toxin-antitoxin system HicA family toxin [Actinobacteria bacterium]|nr:type II toxin-antitoxin system HicA family toxin [Actinomycetota bacterium]
MGDAGGTLGFLQGKLGYEIERQSGSHRRLVAEGRPPLTFAFHDNASSSPGVVRDILVKQVGLDRDEALRWCGNE